MTIGAQGPAPAPPHDRPMHFARFVRELTPLGGPVATAIDNDDNIYVVQTEYHRIQVLDSQGVPTHAWGSFGTAPSRFISPRGIAVADDGRVFVADTGNHRIQVFSRTGAFEAQWGSRGPDAGKFLAPRGIAVDRDRVYVADTANDRVQVFDRAGTFLLAIGAHGHHPGRFSRPADLTVDPQGNIYVADTDHARIQKFDPRGRHLKTWGDWGLFAGLLAAPAGIDFHRGALFVADTGNHRIQVFDPRGNVLYEWGTHVILPREGRGKLHYPDDISVAPSGRFALVPESLENRCQVFAPPDPQDPPPPERQSFIKGAGAGHYGPRCSTAADLLAVAEPDTHSILLFDLDAPTPVMITTIGGLGAQFGRFRHVTDVQLSPSGEFLYAADRANRRLQMFRIIRDRAAPLRFVPNMARFVKSIDFNVIGRTLPDLNLPWPIEPVATRTALDGTLYCLDQRNARVFVFDPQLEFVRTWGAYGTSDGQCRFPTDIALNQSGDIVYVVDAHTHRVQAFTPQGRFLFAWGRRGKGPGEFLAPFAICAGRDGHVYVIDTVANRVQKFTERGLFVSEWGTPGLGAGQFHKPRGIVRDRNNRLIVLDHGNHRAQIFTPDGEFIRAFGARWYVNPTRTKRETDTGKVSAE